MKIYFGRIDKNVLPSDILTDAWLYEQLQEHTIEYLAAKIENDTQYANTIINTFNPLFVNYFTDDYVKNNVFYMKENILTCMKDDEFVCKKLTWGGGSDVLCDTIYITL